ncbi:uncharacterized protein LOC127862953 [Dreissena polymorpha]|uniref:uncharacterized protein LOC127862953 n=1 Tax=Dreissena polymorpha TaxID=45954 RepID=UPI002263E001|nr:uncharacterized protein LOC127862953 [Dreissena polymorpha]
MRYMVMEKYVMLVLLVSAEANAVFNRLNFEQVELAPNATCFPAILVTPTGSAVRCAIACSRHEDCVGFLTDAAEKCFVFPRNAAGITEVCNFSGARYFRLDVATTPTPQMTTPVDVATTLTPQMTTSLAIVNCQNFLRYNPTSGSCSSECPSFGNTFRKMKDTSTAGESIHNWINKTVEECQAMCTADVTCAHVLHVPTSMVCYTYRVPELYEPWPGIDCYIRNCA